MNKYYLIIVLFTLYWRQIKADCNVVSKKQWDGLDPVHVQYIARPVDLVIIQHTVTPTCKTNKGCAELVQNMQTHAMETLNYWDIGSNFLIGGNGKVYEGAGWLHVGAHTYGYNSKALGITFIGNFNNDEVKPSMIDALKALLKCGVDNGHLTPDYHIVGHRQLISTESPGRKLYNIIRRLPQWLEDVSSIKN